MKKAKIESVSLKQEMEESYLAYSMAVIVGRALPDIYDGLKPVQRRILTGMKDLGLKPESPYKKAARVCGEVMGKYHPHGEAYGSMVTMAAPYANNHVLIDGHGNWGSPTDNAAASRYTECRLSSYSEEVLLQHFALTEKKDNYDGSLQEPVRLEAKVPNVLITGSEGIGVGYATNVPQHNLRGVVRAAKELLKGKSPKSTDLIPDFPSGCDIVKDEGLKTYLQTGSGSIRMRAKVEISLYERSGRKNNWHQLVFTNLPYQSNTEQVGEEIRKGLENGKIQYITEIRDESDRTGERLVVFCTRDPELVASQLYRYTRLEKTFGCNNTVIENMVPKKYAPHEIIFRWLQWRDERLVVQFTSEKEALERRLHIVEGLLFALSKIDAIIKLIRKAKDKAEARTKLMGRGYNLTEIKANAILDMRLHQLTGLDEAALKSEKEDLESKIQTLSSLISDKTLRNKYLEEELDYIQKRHGNSRRCRLIESPKEILPVKGAEKKKSVPTGVKTRYLKLDMSKGIPTQLKGSRGANLAVPDNDKIIAVGYNGQVKRLPSWHKVPFFDEPTQMALVERQSIVEKEEFLAVWIYDGCLYSNVVVGDQLRRTTSTGKRWLREGAELLHFGTKPYTLKFTSKRRKDKKLTLKNVKKRALGGVGNKLFTVEELILE